MSKKDSYLNDAGKRERLALAGLAADRKTAMEPCPDAERFAEFLEADPASPEQQSFVKHLAACASCRQKWLVLSEELVETDRKMTRSGAWYGNRGLLSVVGSACALAAGVMLYLAIDYRPATFNIADSPAPERAQEAPVDQELNQVGVADSDVLPRKKSRVEELAEADTAEPAPEVVLDRKESRVPMSVESAPKPAPVPVESLGVQTSSKKAGPPAEEEGFSAKADAPEFQESPVDEELNEAAVADSGVLPRKKSRVEKLAEVDTAEPAPEVVLDRKESRVPMSVESAPKPAPVPVESLGVQTSSKKAGPPAEEEGFSAKADAPEFQESPADEELNQAAVADSDVLPWKKSRVEKLAEADTAEPAPEVVLDRKKSRVLMSVESAPKPASAPAKALEMQTSSKKAGLPDEEDVFSVKADALEFQESLEAFFESFSSHCQSREAGGTQGADLTNMAEQGRALLKLEETMEIPYQELIREIVQLLAQKEPVKDTELDELCRQTGRVTAEMDKAGL